jgi:hypothetical protein
MNETTDGLTKKSFDLFDEQDLSLVLNQVARRMLALRPNTPDIGFWYSTLFRISRFLNSFPALTEEDKQSLLKNRGAGKIAVIRKLQERTGMRLKPCHEIVKAWMLKNMPGVD